MTFDNRRKKENAPEPGVSRREFLATGSAAAALGLNEPLETETVGQDDGVKRSAPPNTIASLENNVFTRTLGVKPHLGAHEHISRLSGSRMPPEVIEAMQEANEFFVDMHELTKAAGARVAELMGAEAAIVTSGAFSAMILAAAACLTGDDEDKIEALPDVHWPKRECLIQTAHRFEYDRAYRAAGMTIVEAKTRDDVHRWIGENTAMIAVLEASEKQTVFAPPLPRSKAVVPDDSVIRPEEFIEVGKRYGVPVLVDTASDIPPKENLTRFIDAGADLVVLSGGKGIRGPQSTGILAGRRDLIEAARLNNSPNTGIGRGMKVGKEELIGLVVALERFVALDYDAEMARWNEKARFLAKELQDVPGLSAKAEENTMGYEDLVLTWDEGVIPLSRDEVKARLAQGSPPIQYDAAVRTRLLRDGEEKLLATRLRQFFSEAFRTP